MITLKNSLNEASGARKIPYDLVSSLAILRDYDVIEDSDYVNEEHKLLVDIADSLFNVGASVANNFKDEYKEVYDKYGKSYFNKVLKDMRALDSQIGSGNVNDLIDEINDKLAAFGGIDESYMIREQDAKIEVKHDGILEVPEGKNVDDLPVSHFEKLAKKKGLGKITKALNNLQVWNKNDDPKLSKWAGNMIDKLNNRMEKKNESLESDDIYIPEDVKVLRNRLSDLGYRCGDPFSFFGKTVSSCVKFYSIGKDGTGLEIEIDPYSGECKATHYYYDSDDDYRYEDVSDFCGVKNVRTVRDIDNIERWAKETVRRNRL